MDRRTLLFLHMPKTGGTTVTGILLRRFPQDRRHRLTGSHPGEAIDRFLRLPERERARLLLVCGHFYYGFHEHLPNPCTYLTMLREPVSRVVSHYAFAASNPGHALHRAATEMSLAEFVRSGCSGDVENTQAKLLSGLYREFRPQGVFRRESSVDAEELLTRARENLGCFAFVGLFERFEESLVLMGQRLGWWGPFAYRSENVTPSRPAAEGLDPDTRRVIEEQNELDLEIYEGVRASFEREMAEAGFGFRAHVAWLRRAGRIADGFR